MKTTQGGFRGPAIPLIVALLCLAPFLGKAFHVDDPLFLWAARQIHQRPFDFYGFAVNWSGVEEPMADVSKNPPGAAYYLALAAAVVGWSERALHLAFLVPALLAVLGTWRLARRMCARPALATLAAILTPAFVVSATNVMCDLPMLALWVWSLALWIEGMEDGGRWRLFFAAVLVAACALTKYFGLALLPLVCLYSLARERKTGRWALYLLLPLSVWTGYHLLSASLYGRGLFSEAASYATQRSWSRGFPPVAARALAGLTFAGGGVVTALFLAPLVWSRRTIVVATLLAFAVVFGLSRSGSLSAEIQVQRAIMALGGASLLGLAAADLRRERDAHSLLLAAWVAGTFVFAAFVNWTVNVRSILPLAPAAGILLARRLDAREVQSGAGGRTLVGTWKVALPLILATITSMAVAWADSTWAGSARDAADRVKAAVGDRTTRIWFEGHWGFQYYMQAHGYVPLDLQSSAPKHGEIVVIPQNNSGAMPLRDGVAEPAGRIEVGGPRHLATMSHAIGAGFYADVWGPLPFAVGSVPPEMYYLFRAR